MAAPELVSVSSLFVRCSLKVRCLNQPGYAASDSCGHMADTAVQTPSGTLLWRCPQHRGVLYVAGDSHGIQWYQGHQTGPVRTEVPRSS